MLKRSPQASWYLPILTLQILSLAYSGIVSAEFLVAPHVNDVSNDSVVLIWETEEPCESMVTYGLHADALETIAVSDNDTIQKVRLTGLESDSIYIYQVKAGDTIVESRFVTAPATARSITFVLTGNTYAWDKKFEESKMWAHMAQWSPEFILNSGNLVESANEPDAWRAHFNRFAPLLKNTWMLTARGNNDGRLLGNRDTDWFARYHALPGDDKAFSSFTWGNTHVIVVANESILAVPEYLDKHMASIDAPHVILLTHTPVYCSGHLSAIDAKKELAQGPKKAVADALDKHGIRLHLSGGTPVYERTHALRDGLRDDQNGTVYVVNAGIGGHYPEWFTATGDQIAGISSPTYTVFRMDEDKVWLRTYAWKASERAFTEIDYRILWKDANEPVSILHNLREAEDTRTRLNAIELLGALAYTPAAETLMVYLQPQYDLSERRAAAKALYQLADEATAPQLLPFLNDTDADIRHHIALALASCATRELTLTLGEMAVDTSRDTNVRIAMMGAVHRHGPEYYTADIAERILMQPNVPETLIDRAAYAMADSAQRIDFEMVLERVHEISTQNALLWLGGALNSLSSGEIDISLDSPILRSHPGDERLEYIEQWQYFMERRLLTERRAAQRRTAQ